MLLHTITLKVLKHRLPKNYWYSYDYFVRLYDNGDGVYLDDEGLYAEHQHFWMHRNYPQPLVNIGAFIGCDPEGETIVPKTSYKQLAKDVRFIGSRYQVALATRVHGHLIDTENG